MSFHRNSNQQQEKSTQCLKSAHCRGAQMRLIPAPRYVTLVQQPIRRCRPDSESYPAVSSRPRMFLRLHHVYPRNVVRLTTFQSKVHITFFPRRSICSSTVHLNVQLLQASRSSLQTS